MSENAPCPFCRHTHARPVSFTWWGGLVGPKILHVVECQGCRKQFNGRTGRSNTSGIIIYSAVGGIIAIVILVVLWQSTR